MFTVGTLTMMGYTAYLVLTFNKPMFKPTRAETGGYDGYDE